MKPLSTKQKRTIFFSLIGISQLFVLTFAIVFLIAERFAISPYISVFLIKTIPESLNWLLFYTVLLLPVSLLFGILMIIYNYLRSSNPSEDFDDAIQKIPDQHLPKITLFFVYMSDLGLSTMLTLFSLILSVLCGADILTIIVQKYSGNLFTIGEIWLYVIGMFCVFIFALFLIGKFVKNKIRYTLNKKNITTIFYLSKDSIR